MTVRAAHHHRLSMREHATLAAAAAFVLGLVLTVLAFVVAVRPETAALGWAGGAICVGVFCGVRPWCKWWRRPR